MANQNADSNDGGTKSPLQQAAGLRAKLVAEALQHGELRKQTKQAFDISAMLLADIYTSLDVSERETLIIDCKDPLSCDVLDACALRLSAFAVREKQPDHLRRAAAMIALANGGRDFRDTLGTIAIMNYCADLMHVNAYDVLAVAESLSLPDLAYGIEQFSQRPPEMKRLDVLGMKRIDTPHGIWFTSDF